MEAAAGYESQGGSCADGTAQPQRAVQTHGKAAHSITLFVPTTQLHFADVQLLLIQQAVQLGWRGPSYHVAFSYNCGDQPRLRTHTFDNHSHHAGAPKLERGSNHGEPPPLTLASRCGTVGPLLPPRGVFEATASRQDSQRWSAAADATTTMISVGGQIGTS